MSNEFTLVEQAAYMIFQLARWLPEHRFRVVADGAYASLLRYDFPRTVIITRLRCDAALNDPAPPRTGRRSRPRTRGDRLPKPPELAKQVTNWTSFKVCVRGQMIERQLWSRTLLWYETARSRPLLLVIVRDLDLAEACRMGGDSLRVADASIVPALPRAAPHLAVAMTAEHLARRLR